MVNETDGLIILTLLFSFFGSTFIINYGNGVGHSHVFFILLLGVAIVSIMAFSQFELVLLVNDQFPLTCRSAEH